MTELWELFWDTMPHHIVIVSSSYEGALSLEARFKYPETRCCYIPAQKYSNNTPCKPPKNKCSLPKLPYLNQHFRQLEWNAIWKRIPWTVWNPNTSLHVRIMVINKNQGIYCEHGIFWLLISSTQTAEYEKVFLWDDSVYTIRYWFTLALIAWFMKLVGVKHLCVCVCVCVCVYARAHTRTHTHLHVADWR